MCVSLSLSLLVLSYPPPDARVTSVPPSDDPDLVPLPRYPRARAAALRLRSVSAPVLFLWFVNIWNF